jgi:hypothetical protein
VVQRTADILRYEQRGPDFALVRIKADGSRSEIVLSPANVVHLGLLAPDFSRRLLADKVGKKSGAMAQSLRQAAAAANVRIISAAMTLLDRSGGRLDRLVTEQRARLLAARLLQRADRLARRPAAGRDAAR